MVRPTHIEQVQAYDVLKTLLDDNIEIIFEAYGYDEYDADSWITVNGHGYKYQNPIESIVLNAIYDLGRGDSPFELEWEMLEEGYSSEKKKLIGIKVV